MLSWVAEIPQRGRHAVSSKNMMNLAARNLHCRCPINKLTVGMFKSSAQNKPKMKTKAAEGRYLLPVVRELLNLFDKTSDHAILRAQCVDALQRCYEELAAWDPANSPTRLAQAARQHLILYTELRRTATRDWAWSLFPKHHLFIHLAEETVVNPPD